MGKLWKLKIAYRQENEIINIHLRREAVCSVNILDVF